MASFDASILGVTFGILNERNICGKDVAAKDTAAATVAVAVAASTSAETVTVNSNGNSNSMLSSDGGRHDGVDS